VRPLHELINTTLAALLGGFVAYIEHGTAVVPPEKLLRAVVIGLGGSSATSPSIKAAIQASSPNASAFFKA